jgi:hypothetical protein
LTRDTREKVVAIRQIRRFAASYRGTRQQFFDELYSLVSQPIAAGDAYDESVNDLYVAAISALTSEVTPPTRTTYEKVVSRLAKAVGKESFPAIRIAVYADDGQDNGDSVGKRRRADPDRMPRPAREWQLASALPARPRLNKTQQAIVDEFRAEVTSAEPPFAQRRRRG